MKTNITRKQINRVSFLSEIESINDNFSIEHMRLLDELIIGFKEEMKKPTMNEEQLLEVWDLIESFSKLDFSINHYSNTNKINDALGEMVDTEGFLKIIDFVNNRAITNSGGYHAIQVRNMYLFFKYSKDKKQSMTLYKNYFQTMFVDMGFTMSDSHSIILFSGNEDFLLENYDELFPSFRVESKHELFSKNVFNILNKNKIFKENDDRFRSNECAMATLKHTDDNSISLNNKQFSRLISLYITYGKNNEAVGELLRVINLEEIEQRLTKKNALKRNKDICLNSKERISAIEDILSIKIDSHINDDGITLTNFNFEDQLWLIDLLKHDTKKVNELNALIKDNKLYLKINNELKLNKEHKDLLELNFKY